MQGQTVFYRLKEADVFDIEHQRGLVQSHQYDDGTLATVRLFHGAPVEEGMMLPAEVIHPYSEYEILAQRGVEMGESHHYHRKQFSGTADIRVKLPGNDVLWVPRAELDRNPTLNEDSYGVGAHVVPEVDKFTVCLPSILI